MKKALRDYAKTFPALTALLGSGSAIRFWHQHAPAPASLPYVVYQAIGGEGINHQQGASALRERRVQFTIVGTNAGETDAVAEALRTSFNRTRATVGGTQLRLIDLDEPVDLPAWPEDGAEAPRPGARIDGTVWYA